MIAQSTTVCIKIHNLITGTLLVFFPGDISNFYDLKSMATFPPEYSSLDFLFWVLVARFVEYSIVLVKAKMSREAFNIYVNFLLVDAEG